jgi:hypothetical protein
LTSDETDRSILHIMLSKSLAALAGLVVVLAGASARADRPRIAVSGVAGDSATPELRDKIARAVAAGLAASGADVRTEPATIAYRVRGTLEVEGRNYLLRLEIVDAKTGEIIDSQEDRCEICTEGEAMETAGISASALKAKVFKRRPTVAVADIPLGAPPAAAPEPKHEPPAIVQVDAEPPPPRAHRLRPLGIAGIAAGAVAAGAGVALMAADGKGSCSDGVNQCPMVYDTKTSGIALIAGGALAVIAGIVILAGRF